MFGGDKFAGVAIKGDQITYKRESMPLAGAHATVDTAGSIDRRLSATRVVLTGGLGLFWKKKQDNREVYLLIEGEGNAFVVKVDPDDGEAARKFAAKINVAAKAATAS